MKKSAQLFVVTLLCVFADKTYAQTTRLIGVSSGVMTSATRDESVGPYVFGGANAFLQVNGARKKKNFVDQLRFDVSSFELTSSIANTPKIQGHYYLLQLGRQWTFFSNDRIQLQAGPFVRGRGFLREVNNRTTGEAVGSLDASGQAIYHMGSAGKLELRAQLPVLNVIAHPVYAQSGQEVRTSGWKRTQATEFGINYVFATKRRTEIVLSYGVCYYGYRFQESVRVATHQFGGGFQIKFEKP